jgi:hypothetical protein
MHDAWSTEVGEQLPAIEPALRRRHQVLAQARDVARRGGSPEQVLWALWSGGGHPWPTRLQAASLHGGLAARQADRDLDAVMALFDMAQKSSHTSAKSCLRFVDEVRQHEVAVSPTVGAAAAQKVRIMTAHRAKGLEWDHVFVCGVQDGVWPNVRPRGAMLSADRITAHGLDGVLTQPQLLAEERRVFYVASTRARRRVWVTCVDSEAAHGGEGRASVFVRELLTVDDDGVWQPGIDALQVARVARHTARSLSTAAVVARLRAVVCDSQDPMRVGEAAAHQLARLCEIPDSGADPDRWWGIAERTEGVAPVRPDGPLRLSGTAMRDLGECTLRWFVEREAAASSVRSTTLVFGVVVHTLCEHIATCADPDNVDVESSIDSVWPAMTYEAPWIAAGQRASITEAMKRFLTWHREQAAQGASTLAVEVPFDRTIDIVGADGEPQSVQIKGRLDRVEVATTAGDRSIRTSCTAGTYSALTTTSSGRTARGPPARQRLNVGHDRMCRMYNWHL